MSEYTPTTRWVREWYAYSINHLGGEQEFDRKVAAKTLMDAAKDSQMVTVAYGWNGSRIASWLKARAKQIEKGSGE